MSLRLACEVRFLDRTRALPLLLGCTNLSDRCALILSVAHSMCDRRSQNPLGADQRIIQSEKSESLKLATGFNNNLIINKHRCSNLRKISLSGQYLRDDQFIYLLFIVTKKLRFNAISDLVIVFQQFNE